MEKKAALQKLLQVDEIQEKIEKITACLLSSKPRFIKWPKGGPKPSCGSK